MVFSDEHPTARIDLFIKAPLDFGAAFQRATFLEVAPAVRASFVGIEDLIILKKQAGRPLDLDDVEKLIFLRRKSKMLSETIAEILHGDDPWHYATFEGAVQLQLKIDARTSLVEKPEWLEQAGRLARQLERQAKVLASGGERD